MPAKFIHGSLKQPQQALAFFWQELALRQQLLDRRDEIAVLMTLGLTYHQRQHYEQAQQYFQQILKLTRHKPRHSDKRCCSPGSIPIRALGMHLLDWGRSSPRS